MQREESIEEQLIRIQDYAKHNDINIIKQYTDYAKSGSKNLYKREEFLNMIDEITSKKIEVDYVLVYCLSRFMRNRYESAIYRKKLADNNVKLSVLLKHLMMVQNLSSWNQYWKVWRNTFQETYPERSCVDCIITQSMVFSQVVSHL